MFQLNALWCYVGLGNEDESKFDDFVIKFVIFWDIFQAIECVYYLSQCQPHELNYWLIILQISTNDT